MPTTSLSHPSVGDLTGKSTNNGQIAQFLGLQYATLADRFSPPALKQYHGEPVDCTMLGPQVLCHMPGPALEQKMLLQHELEYDPNQFVTSELEGLNLNVTVPLGKDGRVQGDRKLPVFAFIHGGGFTTGSASFPQYDMARLVELSVANGMPIIAVAFNYRLSAPGLLTSKELRDAGYLPNNALRDQQTALLWIQKHIAGFGGDADNVTLMGQSAGAISVSWHLHSEKPLFKRCMLMGGTHILKPPPTLEQCEGIYHKTIEVLGLGSKTPQERIAALNSMDWQELSSKTFAAGVLQELAIDNDLVSVSPSFAGVSTGAIENPGRKWCESIMIGDVQYDGNIMSLAFMPRMKGLAAAFCSSITSSLPENIASRLLSSFNLTPDTADDMAIFHICEIFNDVFFYAPTLALAENLSRSLPVYMYRFNEPNPWPGKWQGLAVHIQDLAWLSQNFNEFMDKPQQEQAKDFATSVIAFANGKECWEKWTAEKKMAKVIGPKGASQVVVDVSPGNGRRNVVFELAEEVGGMDKLNAALGRFMMS